MTRQAFIEDIYNNMCLIKKIMFAAGHAGGNDLALGHTQMMVLRAVEKNEGTGIKDLANLLSISPSAVTQIVDGLVEKGLLTREIDLKDRRAISLSITAAASDRIAEIKKQTAVKVISAFEVLSDDELATFALLNKKLAEKITGN
ncbi:MULTISPECIES: MarR family winged helix-turn-helix transcriptional regulator [Dehalococcoides]|jgi:DNA-binding MarR family transcriptional regulator|uniref:MarR family winged helix-turn-helix transcriptional regulator n=1 Tax=Dehalococcoides TaxID=61434 RepID=UPI0003C86967|nr:MULTISPECIES: MarR family winged helix-turn-helix transcriptional regulator [Dehalococcoides]AHB14200.1 MarR family transcriptional regulator [Dehalococcoides mccartyi GY50]AII58551.1 MarR family transcriptional regulator [Dehalococcoides mccartyi CG1]APH11672.1 MarR family transcriptional regulator [Dehalococcoides mccartyi]QYY58723.1 MarR family winged helix-turn-helix transcriptional regulator [Dehalococcoides mccartyi]BAQ35375.1 MarR family transcriptional regulator [Dehalococcoides sp.